MFSEAAVKPPPPEVPEILTKVRGWETNNIKGEYYECFII